MKDLVRSSLDHKTLILTAGIPITRETQDVCLELGVSGIVRVHFDEFEKIDRSQPYFSHFNLESTNHHVGSLYAIVPIVTPGSFRGNVEQLPVLDISYSIRATCIDAQNHIAYDEIAPSYFEYSLPHVRTVDQLKASIVGRYSRSLPNIPPKKLLEHGVAYTLFSFTK